MLSGLLNIQQHTCMYKFQGTTCICDRICKTRHNSAFFKFHFYKKMYVLEKFQLCILKAFKVAAVQSSSNTKIDLYSKYREKLKVLTKIDVTYESSEAQTRNLLHYVYHELWNGLLGKFFMLPCITISNVKIYEETSIMNKSFNVT